MENMSSLIDDYANADLANSTTVECLLIYLDLPGDKTGIAKKFKSVVEIQHVPDKKKKEGIYKHINR
jgi:hypothetical protein